VSLLADDNQPTCASILDLLLGFFISNSLEPWRGPCSGRKGILTLVMPLESNDGAGRILMQAADPPTVGGSIRRLNDPGIMK
jgi:hypothetical protein